MTNSISSRSSSSGRVGSSGGSSLLGKQYLGLFGAVTILQETTAAAAVAAAELAAVAAAVCWASKIQLVSARLQSCNSDSSSSTKGAKQVVAWPAGSRCSCHPFAASTAGLYFTLSM
jgi:hypothetical protein